ncbi:MAG: hypothetical protein PHW04_18330 [Candidatus Wallbacteria bacterium]|nr:hypothetical protein [Candidatus Wallbacteria bacterium]
MRKHAFLMVLICRFSYLQAGDVFWAAEHELCQKILQLDSIEQKLDNFSPILEENRDLFEVFSRCSDLEKALNCLGLNYLRSTSAELPLNAPTGTLEVMREKPEIAIDGDLDPVYKKTQVIVIEGGELRFIRYGYRLWGFFRINAEMEKLMSTYYSYDKAIERYRLSVNENPRICEFYLYNLRKCTVDHWKFTLTEGLKIVRYYFNAKLPSEGGFIYLEKYSLNGESKILPARTLYCTYFFRKSPGYFSGNQLPSFETSGIDWQSQLLMKYKGLLIAPSRTVPYEQLNDLSEFSGLVTWQGEFGLRLDPDEYRLILPGTPGNVFTIKF